MMVRSLVCNLYMLATKVGYMAPSDLIRIQETLRQFSEGALLARELSKRFHDLAKLVTPPNYPQWEASGQRLAELGWIPPMGLTIRETVELSDPANTDEDIERYIVNFYLCDQHKQLRRLHDDLMRSKDLTQWHPLLAQCFEAFELNLHLVTIPSLLSVLEGAVAQKCHTLRTKNTRLIEPSKAKASQAKQGTHYTMEALIWSSVATFIEKLYEPFDFRGNRPSLINRHWILHGRDSTQWTIADSIRLFNALPSIV